MIEPPVRLCCGQRHMGPVCPDGKTMCCVCFDRFNMDDLMMDDDGVYFDVCKGCEPLV